MFERGSASLFILVCSIMYIIIFQVIVRLPRKIKDYQYFCFAKCQSNTCKDVTKRLRDKDYWMDPGGNIKTDTVGCGMTTYELTHLLFHVWIGYEYGLCTSAVLSSSFEVFEHLYYNCGSYLDLVWNMMGAFIGVSLRYYVNKH